jgi:hypothetical protein
MGTSKTNKKNGSDNRVLLPTQESDRTKKKVPGERVPAIGKQSLAKMQSQGGIRRLRGKVQWEGDLNARRTGRTPEA